MTDKIIDAYLGFMDEEVNTLVKKLIDTEKAKQDITTRRPVLLVERNHVNLAGPVLEWPVSRYGVDIRCIAYASAGSVEEAIHDGRKGHEITKETTFPEHILARAIHAFLQRDDQGDEALREKNIRVLRMIDVHQLATQVNSKAKLKVALDGSGPELSVVRFDLGEPDATLQPPIIVIRAPEMGLQPSLMSPYIEFILMMISALSSELAHLAGHQDEWQLRLSCYGAQGGAASNKQPGSLSTICASLYVGYEYVNQEAQPSIALCSQGGIYHFSAGEPLPGDGLAGYFIRNHDKLVVSHIEVDTRYTRKEEAGIKSGMKLKDVVDLIVKNYTVDKLVPEVSGTSSWFIGAEQKEAFAHVGITGCNIGGLLGAALDAPLRLAAGRQGACGAQYVSGVPARVHDACKC